MNKDALEAGGAAPQGAQPFRGALLLTVSRLLARGARSAARLDPLRAFSRTPPRCRAADGGRLLRAPGTSGRIPAVSRASSASSLHAWDWSETSLLLDVLTVRYGRVFLVARGARRASSQYRGLLTAFCPLRFSWTGSKEAKMLVRAEWQGTMVPLTGEALLSGFYVNELILKLTVREERHPGLFEAYVKARSMRWRSTSATPCSPRFANSRWRSSRPQAGRPLFSDDGPLALVLRQGTAPSRGSPASKGCPRACAPGRGPRARNAFGRADESCGASRLA